MAFNRAAILHAAHATARYRMANTRSWRSYRQAFADALRREWSNAKAAAAQEAAEAEDVLVKLPAAVVAECAAIRAYAFAQPHTSVGHARFHVLHAEADELHAAARLSAIAALGIKHRVVA